MPDPQAKTIEDLLFEKGLLTSDQLSLVKLEAVKQSVPVEKIILDHKMVAEEEVIKARAQFLNVPYLKLEGRSVASEVLISIPETVARRYHLIPFEKEGDLISVAMVDPLDQQVLEFLEQKTQSKIKPYLAAEKDIEAAIEEQYAQSLTAEVTAALKEAGGPPVTAREEKEAEVIREAPVAKIVSQLLEYGIKSNASDCHVEPLEDKTRVRFRLDGILHEKLILPKKVHDAVISRIKILSGMKIDEKRIPQDGRFNFRSAGQEVDLRVSTLPTSNGEKVVMRLLRKTGGVPTLPELGLRATALKNLETQLLRPHGIILVCGPTGSGKTTTLYSVLSKINSVRVNILTLEDPIEYKIAGINQVQINPQAGLTFANGLRSFLRQDPNIIMVGEIRDTDTADLAIQAALTGHLVFSTLHTNNAAGALPRLLDMGAEPYLLASTITGVVGQRVVRRIDTNCKESFEPPREIFARLKDVLGKLYPAQDGKSPKLWRGKGCPACNHTGYLGRIGIFEVLVVSEKIGRLILERSPTLTLEEQAEAEGMITMKQDGFLKVLEGMTTVEEVLRVAEE
jgi:type IV pilus assembly protein PilB